MSQSSYICGYWLCIFQYLSHLHSYQLDIAMYLQIIMKRQFIFQKQQFRFQLDKKLLQNTLSSYNIHGYSIICTLEYPYSLILLAKHIIVHISEVAIQISVRQKIITKHIIQLQHTWLQYNLHPRISLFLNLIS